MSATRAKHDVEFQRFVRVALPVPLFHTFTYGVPESSSPVVPGCRVWVRFGKRVLLGCVIAVEKTPSDVPAGSKVQPLLKIVDDEPVLTPPLLSLAKWIADYYVSPPGEVYRGLLPPETPRSETVRFERTDKANEAELKEGSLRAQALAALSRPMTAVALAKKTGKKNVSQALRFLVDEGYVRKVEKVASRRPLRIWAAAITDQGRKKLESGELKSDWARVLSVLATATEDVPLGTIRKELGLKEGPFRSLKKRDYIRLSKQEISRSPWHRLDTKTEKKPTLTESQEKAFARIRDAVSRSEFCPMVLHGVTGSGKTEVYLSAVESTLALGRSALLLVPEIALTPRLAALLRSRFGTNVAILHSALGSGERRDEWWRVRRGEARVVVGARAAVLAPLDNVGLVVVDEEHESSYKQDEIPRYNARDVAIVRARDQNAVVVLGSATPSLNSYTHAVDGRYELANLPERIGGRGLAKVELIDMKDVVREEGPETILSRPLREALESCFASGEQALILLNRRGYASHLICRQCGLTANCTECSVALTLHQKGTLAICHYCGLGRPTPSRCDVCQGEYLKHQGYGTERIEEHVKELFSDIRVARMDRDTMRKKGSHEALLSRFASGKLDLLVGTQMLAKGHDFPGVTLAGVLAADAGLGVPDFRAAERTFQLLTQVAGRAGRGERPGNVFIQTFSPEHYSLQHACEQDYEGFYKEEMGFRRSLRYPPVLLLINLVFEGKDMRSATSDARRAAAALEKSRPDGVAILGPAFAVRSKVAGRYRCQVLIKLPRNQHANVRHRIRSLLNDPSLARNLLVDIDPYSLY
jgi:primosomal protein N' (replication factor Y)